MSVVRSWQVHGIHAEVCECAPLLCCRWWSFHSTPSEAFWNWPTPNNRKTSICHTHTRTVRGVTWRRLGRPTTTCHPRNTALTLTLSQCALPHHAAGCLTPCIRCTSTITLNLSCRANERRQHVILSVDSHQSCHPRIAFVVRRPCSLPLSACLAVIISSSTNPFRWDFFAGLCSLTGYDASWWGLGADPRTYSYLAMVAYRLLRRLIPSHDAVMEAFSAAGDPATADTAAANSQPLTKMLKPATRPRRVYDESC